MKNIVSILLIGLLLASCNKEVKKTDGYVINGTANDVYNGIRVYLKSADERGIQTPQDTAIVMDGTFKFEGKVEYPQMWYLSVDNIKEFIPLIIENEVFDVKFNKDQVDASTVTGTKANDALKAYSQGFKNLIDENNQLRDNAETIMNSTDSLAKAKLNKDFEKGNQDIQNYPLQFLKENNKTYFSLSLIINLLKGNPADLQPIIEAYDNLDTNLKKTDYGKIVGVEIDVLKKKNERLAMLDIGKISPNFSAPNPDGKQVSLNEIKGKATIIDFWASWCGPCRRENPNVVKVYEKFHDKGLEIISVSLDRPGQTEKWLQAIKDDKLTWHHVSNLMYFNDPVAQQYNIQSIPATFILDADGIIVAKSLRGQALEDKIAEMLN
jgi:peroxiredoxin/uncharacterized protein YdcH (DUF465 family)